MNKVVCVYNKYNLKFITIGKIYNVTKFVKYYYVICDDLLERAFHEQFFINLDEYRGQKLNLILNE